MGGLTDPDLRLLSYGGGTQSAALALMTAAGDLPKLDAVIFADTQGELPETYEYAEYVKGHLEAAGIPFIRVTAGSLEDALLDPMPRVENPTPPAHMLDAEGNEGRINGYRCSWDLKRAVITREVKRLCGARGAWKRSTVEQWLGFSTDEVNRVKPAQQCRCGHNRTRPPYKDTREPRGHLRGGCTDCACSAFDPWLINTYPLLDLGFRRGDTIRWFTEHGHPTPTRSACWFCPNQGNARWRELREEHPDLWERACVIDETIRDGSGFNRRGSQQPLRNQLFLHRGRIPLRNADLRSAVELAEAGGQPALFDEEALASDCAAGVCFT